MKRPTLSPRTFTALAWLAVLGVVAFNELGLIRQDPVLSRDDQALIRPIEHASSITEYVGDIESGRALDLQPVRDASLWIDVQLGKLGLHTFHATNAVLLLILLALIQRFFTQRFGARPAIAVAVLIYACHPIVANTVSWIAARKHLLAAVFVLAATVLMDERQRAPSRAKRAAAVLTYALSVLSQPITLLWPLWLAADRWLKSRDTRKALVDALPFAPIMIGVGVINYFYYNGIFVALAHGNKFVEVPPGPGTSLLAIGRYLFNCIFPIAIATSYDPGRIYNFIGLLVLPALFFASVKFCRRDSTLSGWLMFVFPLLPVTARMTNIFVSDTYLLVPLVGVLMVGLSAWETAPSAQIAGLAGLGGATGIVIWFAMTSHHVAASWRSEAALWDRAFHIEPTPNGLAKQSFYVLKAGKPQEAVEIAERLLAWAPEHPEAAYVYAHAISMDDALSPDEKLRRLDAAPAQDAWTSYFGAEISAKRGDFEDAFKRASRIAHSAQRFGDGAGTVAAEVRYFCVRAGHTDCQAIVDRFRAAAGATWDESKYDARLRSLGLTP